MDPLVTDAQLAALAQTEAVSEAIRSYCGWHVAPVVQTVKRMPELLATLPTLKLVSLDSITQLTDGSAVDLTMVFSFENGVINWPDSWCSPHHPLRNIEVTMTHGYEKCPADLMGVVKSVIRRGGLSGAGSVTTGPFQMSFPSPRPGMSGVDFDSYEQRILDRYRLPEFA